MIIIIVFLPSHVSAQVGLCHIKSFAHWWPGTCELPNRLASWGEQQCSGPIISQLDKQGNFIFNHTQGQEKKSIVAKLNYNL